MWLLQEGTYNYPNATYPQSTPQWFAPLFTGKLIPRKAVHPHDVGFVWKTSFIKKYEAKCQRGNHCRYLAVVSLWGAGVAECGPPG